MRGYQHIHKVIMPFSCIEIAYLHMRKAGRQGVEGVALFDGREKDETGTFGILKTIVPAQKAYMLEEGLLYAVTGDELYRINVWLYENKMSMIAQIHSHPTIAYHSTTDDAFPIVATLGGISIVVPDFARGDISIDKWAVYRLNGERSWTELNYKQKKELIQIVE